jgi:hypothetical protein
LITEEAMARSGELRRMGFRIRQRELELIAARNQLLPQLDIIGLYRTLGVGDRFGTGNPVGDDDFPNVNSSAWDQLWEGRFQEFRMGFDMQMPLGLRREMAQVRSSQLALARERARLQDSELETIHQLTDAIQNLDAGYRSVRTNLSRRFAAEQQVEAVEAAYLAGTVALDLLLDAQRRQADANISYYQALIDYNLAIGRVHYRKGSLLEYNGVRLAEGPWPEKAYFDATNEARRRDASHYLNYGFSRPNVISRGPASKRWKKGSTQLASTASAQPYSGDTGSESESSLEPIPSTAADSDNNQNNDGLGDALQDAMDSMTGEQPSPADASRDIPNLPSLEEPASPGEISPPAPSNNPDQLDLDLEASRAIRPVSANMPILGNPRIKHRTKSSMRTKVSNQKVRPAAGRGGRAPSTRKGEATVKILPKPADIIDIRWK